MSREAYPELIAILSDFSTKSFTELQAAAYVALIKMGEESGSAVAGEAGINRSKIYDILGQLEEMGAVKKVSRDGRTRYVAVSPDDLLPKLIDKFREDISKAHEGLKDIQDLQEEIEEAKITLTSIDMSTLDTNDYLYLISSSDRKRVKFTEKLSRDNRPGTQVRILDLNIGHNSRGFVLLLNENECYLFGTPTGMRVEALHISSTELVNFIKKIIEAGWTGDLPDIVMSEIKDGDRLALIVDKALFVEYEFYPKNQLHKYERPISMVVSNEHISYFYEGNEELRIPLQFISSVEILDDGTTIRALFSNPSKPLGELKMRVSSQPYIVRNILRHIINTNR